MKLGYTIVYVKSVQASLSFYNEAFGLKTLFVHNSGGYGELDTGETTLAFASHETGEQNFGGNYQKSKAKDAPFGMEIALVAEDVETAYKQAVDAGAEAFVAPQEKPWGQTVAYVRDLDGVLIEICSPIAK